GGQVGGAAAAVEDGDVMAARDGVADLVRSGKAGAAEDQDAQCARCGPDRRGGGAPEEVAAESRRARGGDGPLHEFASVRHVGAPVRNGERQARTAAAAATRASSSLRA